MELNFRTKQLQYIIDQLAKDTTTTGPEILQKISVLDTKCWVVKVWELVESATIQNCFAEAGFLYTISDEFMCDSSDDDEISLSMLRLSKDLFSFDCDNLPGIDSQIQTCQRSADWDLPVRVTGRVCSTLTLHS